MPKLLEQRVVDDYVDSLMENVINPNNISGVMRTVPALDVHSKNPEDIAYTVNHYFKKLDKKFVYFCDYKESPNPVFLGLLRDSVNLLINQYGFKYNQIVYVSGFLPVKSNYEKLKKLYKDFDIPPIENKNVFYFEEEWKKVMNSNEFHPNYHDLSPLHSRNLREKKFLYYMGGPRPHRLATLDFLIKEHYIKDCYYSCLTDKQGLLNVVYGCSHHPIHNLSFNFENIEHTLNNFKENFPKTLTSELGDNPSQHFFSKGDIYYHANTYYSIVPETSYFKKEDEKSTVDPFNFHVSDFTFITEKTMRAIGALHPFVLLSRPYSLQGLKELGYKTFHPYIDESYDLEEKDDLRFYKIKNVIRRLNSKTDSEWLRFQHDIYPIVKHNHDWLRADKVRKVAMHFSSL